MKNPSKKFSQKPIITPLDNDWRWIRGYKGFYAVSERGEVWSTRSEKLLKPSLTTTGYLFVGLSRGNKAKLVRIQVLVARAFIGKRPLGYQINHLNLDKKDNNIKNLEYCTPGENTQHYYNSLPKKCSSNPVIQIFCPWRARGVRQHKAVMDDDKVRFIRTTLLKTKRLARKFKVSEDCIRKIKRRINWKHVA